MNKGADPMSYDNSGHHYSDCTGPGGCDCDERRYGYRGGGGGGCLTALIGFIFAMGVLYAFAVAGGALLFVLFFLAVLGFIIMKD